MKPGETSLTPLKDGIFENGTGFAMQVLVDLQKVLCCLQITQLESQGIELTNSHRLYFKEASGTTDYSSRVALALRQSSAWKCLGSIFRFNVNVSA